MKKAFSVILRIVISLALLFFLFRKVDRQALFNTLQNINIASLLVAFFVLVFIHILCLLRWEMLLKALHIRLPLKKIAVPFFGGIFFNLFLPSTIGGDVVRTMHLVKHTQKNKEIIASVFLDRLSGYIGLILVALLALLFGYKLINQPSVLMAIGIFTAVLIVVLVVLFNKFIYRKINRFFVSLKEGHILEPLRDLHDEIHFFRHKKRIIAANIVFSIAIQLAAVVVYYFTAIALGLKIDPIYFLIFVPIIGAITLLPISIGGLGLRDASTIFFFTRIGVSRDAAFAMSLLNFSFIIITGLVGGIIYVITLHPRRL